MFKISIEMSRKNAERVAELFDEKIEGNITHYHEDKTGRCDTVINENKATVDCYLNMDFVDDMFDLAHDFKGITGIILRKLEQLRKKYAYETK